MLRQTTINQKPFEEICTLGLIVAPDPLLEVMDLGIGSESLFDVRAILGRHGWRCFSHMALDAIQGIERCLVNEVSHNVIAVNPLASAFFVVMRQVVFSNSSAFLPSCRVTVLL
jgi:hypothetical protein